jgi:hypothetical protein
MRRVYKGSRSRHELTESQRRLQKWFEEAPREFLKELAQLEATHLKATASAKGKEDVADGPGVPQEVDEPLERCIELCESLLGSEEADQDGRCITCGRPMA